MLIMKGISLIRMENWLKVLRKIFLALFNFKIVIIKVVVSRFTRQVDLYATIVVHRLLGQVRNSLYVPTVLANKSMFKRTILFV